MLQSNIQESSKDLKDLGNQQSQIQFLKDEQLKQITKIIYEALNKILKYTQNWKQQLCFYSNFQKIQSDEKAELWRNLRQTKFHFSEAFNIYNSALRKDQSQRKKHDQMFQGTRRSDESYIFMTFQIVTYMLELQKETFLEVLDNKDKSNLETLMFLVLELLLFLLTQIRKVYQKRNLTFSFHWLSYESNHRQRRLFQYLSKDNNKYSLETLQFKRILFQVLEYPSVELAMNYHNENLLKYQEQNAKNEQSNIGGGTVQLSANYCCHAIAFVFMFLIYSIYALVTNIKSFNENTGMGIMCLVTDESCGVFILNTGSKLLNQNEETNRYSVTQSYIGLGLMIAWGFAHCIYTYVIRLIGVMQQSQSPSEAKRTFQITNVPLSFLISNKEVEYLSDLQIKENLEKLIQSVNQQNYQPFDPLFKIKKVTLARPLYLLDDNDSRLANIKSNINMFLEGIRNLIYNKEQNDYQKAEIKNQILFQKFCFISRKVQGYIFQPNNNILFVTTQKQLDEQEIVEINHYFRKPALTKILGKTKISLAYEPEEIIWQTIGFPELERKLKKILGWIATFALLGISLSLNTAIALAKDQQLNLGLSMAISLVIIIINIAIKTTINLFNRYSKQQIHSREQYQKALKIGCFQIFNTVVTPILVVAIAKHRDKNHSKTWLQAGGLADDVLFLAFTNAVIVPFVQFLDPGHLLHQIKRWWHCKPENRLHLHGQEELNKYFGNHFFQIGQQYTYLINTSVYTCFFVSMQPIIPIFACLGYYLYLKATSRNIREHYRIPPYRLGTINKAVCGITLLCLLAFGLGHLFVNQIVQQQFNYQNNGTLYINIANLMFGFISAIVCLFIIFYIRDRKISI